MASPSIAAFFNVRKRAAADDLSNTRRKAIRLDDDGSNSDITASQKINAAQLLKEKLGDAISASSINQPTIFANVPNATKAKVAERKTTRRVVKRNVESDKEKSLQPRIVKFTLAGTLSPKKKIADGQNAFQLKPTNSRDNSPATNRAVPAPTNTVAAAPKPISVSDALLGAKKDLSFDEIKSRVNRSSKLQELKDILARRKQLEDQLQACQQKRTGKLRSDALNTPKPEGHALKKFDTIELEVLSSPQKGMRTPTKHDPNDIMSPKKEMTPKRLFSPTKSPTVPAYQRYQTLAEAVHTTLPLPYKYRCLSEVFRCVESICAMFYNRRERITFKKLKPAVQRMLRKNFTEKHLAQIKYLYPDAYSFEQRKMLNPGSHTKYDYYQLIICPNVQQVKQHTQINATSAAATLDEDNILKNADNAIMNPHVIIARQQKFNKILMERVKEEHDKFLKNLDVPLNIPKDKIRRWHQEFELEACADILCAELPQPPNIEKFSSAKDILSTARNLFNCATPLERAMERFDAANTANDVVESPKAAAAAAATPEASPAPATPTPAEDAMAKALKGVPKSLLEKIRAKQAARAYEAMTRRPSQDLEASNYSRLPELAKHVRNIFVTESKGVLELDKVLTKLENSCKEKLPRDILKELLELLGKEAPRNWLTFHYIRKTDFIKINRNANLSDLVKELERKAQEKAQ